MANISFWRAVVGHDPTTGVLEPFKHQHVCQQIAAIDWKTRVPEPMWFGASMISESAKYNPLRVTFAAVRSEELVLAENGQLAPFHLDDGVGIAALTRAVFFPRNVVGICMGPRAPSASFIAKFLSGVSPDVHAKVKLVPLFRGDAETMLNQIKTLNDFRLKIKPVDVSKAPPGAMRDAVAKVKEAGFGIDAEGYVSIQLHAGADHRLRNIKEWIRRLLASEAAPSSKVSVIGLDDNDEKIEIRFDKHLFQWPHEFEAGASARTIYDTIADYFRDHSSELAMAVGMDMVRE